MHVYWDLFLAFFTPGILGYGGGPSSIPLIQNEVVNRYEWYSMERFGEIFGIANSLPGPIATKMAGYIGYEVAGFSGACVALFATIAPSLVAMVLLLSLLYAYKNSPKVIRITHIVRPSISVLLFVMAWKLFSSTWGDLGPFHTVVLIGLSVLLMKRWNVHPGYMILFSMMYGVLIM